MHLAQLLAAGAILALLTWAHYAFWSWRYRAPPREDELLLASTRDGWQVALGRRRPRGAGPLRGLPVLLVHGIAANRGSMDFGLERWSLAAHLAAAGFDCFALDLRGHGASRRGRRDAPRRWSFDDYLRLDVPAALDAVRAATGSPRVLWVGHSQGALLGLAAAGVFPERIAGVAALAAPVFFDVQDPLKLVVRFGFLVSGRYNRFLARCLAPWSGWWHPPVSQVAINGYNVERAVYRRVLANVVENISSGVLRQFGGWIAADRWASSDGRVDYRAALGACRQPALFLAAEDDRIAPPSVVARAAAAWGGPSELARVGVASRASVDYGHSDLLFGKNAPEEVFPLVCDWAVRAAEDPAARSRLAVPPPPA